MKTDKPRKWMRPRLSWSDEEGKTTEQRGVRWEVIAKTAENGKK